MKKMKSAICMVLVSLMVLTPGITSSAQPDERDDAAPATSPPSSDANPPAPDQGRTSFFIVNTIANLRGLDPAFGGRTLTLVDGRRVAPARVAAPPSFVLTALDLPATWKADRVLRRRLCGVNGCSPGVDLVKHPGDGSTHAFFVNLVGDFVALPRSSRIVDCANWPTDAGPAAPSIIDLNGTRTPLPPHPAAVRTCSTVGNGDQVLLAYSIEENGKRLTLARVFNADGKLLAEGRYPGAGKLKFRDDGRRHSAAVPAP